MKYKKLNYLLVLVLMLVVGINEIYAAEAKVETCNYLTADKTAMAKLEVRSGYDVAWFHGGKAYSKVFVNKLGGKIDDDTETILNWYDDFEDGETGITLNKLYNGSEEANKNPTCPTYLIVRTNEKFSSYGAFATESLSVAEKFVNESNATGKFKTWYLVHKNEDGSEITTEQYYSQFVTPGTIIDPNAKITCDELFGDKNDKNSIAYIIDLILGYVRIIIPIIIIVLGSLDLAKAVIAGKEDEMKKAQTTFVKRVILGVVIFFVPLLVNLIMELADITWEGMGYSVCEFK